MRTIAEMARELIAGRTTAVRLAEACLERAQAADGEGARVFVALEPDKIRFQAQASDAARARGLVATPLAGIPISVKDLFDVQGEVTRAGSRALADRPPAERDAPVIARLRAAGAVLFGRTNMTEFAYSGVGMNPHYGTPACPWDRATGRVPGGSSSGATVSVADGMAIAALGTDTGGSCRIPAALCGTVGYKPTASRIPRDGVTPLSFSLDSIGSFGASVGCVAAIDAVMAGAPVAPVVARPAASLRLGVVRNLVLDELDGDVARTYDAALRALAVAGTQLVDVTLSCLGRLPALATKGSLTAPEAAHWHRALIATKGNVYDPRVRTRIELGATQTAVEYLELLAERRAFIAELDTSTRGLDALVMPTCPIVAPPMAAFDTDDAFRRLNLLLLRNTLIGNLADRCSISLPCHAPGGPPVGFMLTGERGADADLFAIAAGVEHVLDEMRGSGRPVL